MSARQSYRVRFVEWYLMEMPVEEATSPEDALNQARAEFIENGGGMLIDNGTEKWSATIEGECDTHQQTLLLPLT